MKQFYITKYEKKMYKKTICFCIEIWKLKKLRFFCMLLESTKILSLIIVYTCRF